MTFYIRYMLTDDKPVTVSQIDEILKEISSDYDVDGNEVYFKDEIIGQIDINEPGDGLFEGDIDLLMRQSGAIEARELIQAELKKTRIMVTVQVLLGGDSDGVLVALEPLFDWFRANRSGLLAIEGGEFWNSTGLLT